LTTTLLRGVLLKSFETAFFEGVISLISTVATTITVLRLWDALELRLGGLVLLVVHAAVQVGSSELLPLAVVNLELPRGLTIAAAFRSVDLKDMHTTVELGVEIEDLGFTTGPDILGVFLHDCTVHHGHSTLTEVGWSLEVVMSTVVAHWEGDLKHETDVLVDTVADHFVRDLDQVVNVLLTVALVRFSGHSRLKFVKVVHRSGARVLLSLDVDGR